MKAIYYLLCLVVFVSCMDSKSQDSPELKALYNRLDEAIAHSEDYTKIKEARIASLKRAYDLSSDGRKRTELLDSIIDEFTAYNADSTLYYISLNLQRPDSRSIPGQHTRLLIKRADLYAHAGLFADALTVIESFPRDSLTDNLLEPYYSACCATYQYLSEYTHEHETAFEYEKRRALYADSLNMVVKPDSFNHLVFVMSEKARNGEGEEAIKALCRNMTRYHSGTREYSILASTLSYIFLENGQIPEYKKYLVLSAISDVEAAVKENMSFREVATVKYNEGDVAHAKLYLKKSIEDANFFSALMRNAQSSKMLPVIDGSYNQLQQRLTSRLRIMVGVSCVLALILLVISLMILKQFKVVKRANAEVKRANGELNELTERLHNMNQELCKRNSELADYNKTKEQYASLFMEYCSSAISTLQQYQQSMRVAVAQGGNKAALLKKLESSEISNQLLKNFYEKFDEAIINIYPSFIEKFNSLLKPGEQSVLKSGEILNTELRLYALIRLGIEDSAKIAKFLRCSISTVYTYRSKMKKRAINPDTFEQDLKNLS